MGHMKAVWCEEHAKWAFTKAQAKLVVRRTYESGLKIYPCKGRFHTGHSVGPNKKPRKETS